VDELGVAHEVHVLAGHPDVRHRSVLAEQVGGPVHLKCENLQRAGSFKIRGAYTASPARDEERARGVVAASAGNHAQGVALAASAARHPATVFMPEGAPMPKVKATGATAPTSGSSGATVDEALVAAREFAAETGAVLIHPFDHADIVAGQGTVGLEILEQCPDVRTVVVCTGVAAGCSRDRGRGQGAAPGRAGGGRAGAGAAAYPRRSPSGTRWRSSHVHHGRRHRGGLPRRGAVRPRAPARRRRRRAPSRGAISRRSCSLLERASSSSSRPGAAASPRLLEAPEAFEPPVVVVLSGGNIDPLLLLRVIRHGLARPAAISTLRVRVPDRPGSLAAAAGELADADANVLEVEHARLDPRLSLDEVDIEVQLETRGPRTATRSSRRWRRPATAWWWSGEAGARAGPRLRPSRIAGAHAAPGREAAVMSSSEHAIVAEGLVKSACSVPNGAGKTTTVRILTTLLTPDAGRAVAGFDVVREARRGAPLDRPDRPVRRGRRVPHRPREPASMFGRLYHLAKAASEARAGAARGVRPRRRRRPARQDLLRRHAPPPRPRRPAWWASRGSSSSTSRPPAWTRAAGWQLWDVIDGPRRGRHDGAAHHAVPRGGRPARRRHRRHRPRPVIAHGTADELKDRSAATAWRSPWSASARASRTPSPRCGRCRRSAASDRRRAAARSPRRYRAGPPCSSTPSARWTAGVKVDDLALRRPTLDDVFLSLTSRGRGDSRRRTDGPRPRPEGGLIAWPRPSRTARSRRCAGPRWAGSSTTAWW
jgi:threonine dehydratase